MKRFLEIGKIVAVQGLKGEVRVEAWCDEKEFLCEFDVLYFDKGETPVEIVRAHPHKNIVLMKIKGVDTVEQAQNLRNKILYMDRDEVELEEGCYFIQDLIGIKVIDADDGHEYGILSDVTETGANNVYHITFPDGSVKLAPVIDEVIIHTDVDEGIMKIRPLKGLFDDDED